MKSAYSEILRYIDVSTLENAYFGSCNLCAEYLNDYSSDGINRFVGEWIEDNVNKSEIGDLSMVDVLENPDSIIQYAASKFFSKFERIVGDDAEKIFRNCKKEFDWGDYYFFANPWSNACADYYLIRADSESSALEILEEKFEDDFLVDDEVNTDNLVLIGKIEA